VRDVDWRRWRTPGTAWPQWTAGRRASSAYDTGGRHTGSKLEQPEMSRRSRASAGSPARAAQLRVAQPEIAQVGAARCMICGHQLKPRRAARSRTYADDIRAPGSVGGSCCARWSRRFRGREGRCAWGRKSAARSDSRTRPASSSQAQAGVR
jgi:hypothetical protein